MNHTSRMLACLALGLVGVVVSPAQAQSDSTYPVRPIRLVVPFPPGGGADLTARLVAQKMTESTGQPVVVENRPGSNGVVGTDLVAKAPADGYTILFVDRGALGINPAMYPKLPYDPLKDFAYVGIATEGPYVLIANPSLNVKTLGELVAVAKAKPDGVSYGSFGVGSMAQMNLESLARYSGIELHHVPYSGAPPAVKAVVAGDVGITIASLPSVIGFIRDGRVRAIVVGAEKRLELLPDVPTIAEAGGSLETLLPTYFAFAAPAGTPRSIITKLNAEMKTALAKADVAEKLAANGLVVRGGTAEAMMQTVRSDVERFATLARIVGVKAE